MVELAGSERIANTAVGGVWLKYGEHINKSLMTLGNILNQLGNVISFDIHKK
jgi:centromeric protein E